MLMAPRAGQRPGGFIRSAFYSLAPDCLCSFQGRANWAQHIFSLIVRISEQASARASLQRTSDLRPASHGWSLVQIQTHRDIKTARLLPDCFYMAPASRATQQRRNAGFIYPDGFTSPVGIAYLLMFSKLLVMSKVRRLLIYSTDQASRIYILTDRERGAPDLNVKLCAYSV